jgi:hypothetical protein
MTPVRAAAEKNTKNAVDPEALRDARSSPQRLGLSYCSEDSVKCLDLAEDLVAPIIQRVIPASGLMDDLPAESCFEPVKPKKRVVRVFRG